jgi:hypothetical protein
VVKTISRKCAFTFVEMTIAAVIGIAVLIFILNFFRFVRQHFEVGVADVEELKRLRYAITYLRRDFNSAVPQVYSKIKPSQKVRLQKDPVVKKSAWKKNEKFIPVLVGKGSIQMFIPNIDTPKDKVQPDLIKVVYFMDKDKAVLARKTEKRTIYFKGIVSADFQIYSHPVDGNQPLLKVDFKMASKNKKANKFLEFSTTICSNVISKRICNKFWYSGSNY